MTRSLSKVAALTGVLAMLVVATATAAVASGQFSGKAKTKPLTFVVKNGKVSKIKTGIYYACNYGFGLNYIPFAPKGSAKIRGGKFKIRSGTDARNYIEMDGTVHGSSANGTISVNFADGSFECRGTTPWSAKR
jgi:hypothetical protein